MTEWLQYAVAWTFVKTLGALPRPVARWLAAAGTAALLWLRPKMRKTAEFNLRLAFPEWSAAQRRDRLRGDPYRLHAVVTPDLDDQLGDAWMEVHVLVGVHVVER